MSQRQCVAPFCGGPAQYRGMACEIHWELLTPETRAALDAYIGKRRPRGGAVHTVPEALMATAYAADGAVRREWRDLLRHDLADGLFDDEPEVAAEIRRRSRG